jgi:SAM-dependent methyltransferase
MTSPEYLTNNQNAWSEWAADYVDAGRRNWAGTPVWGVFGIDEADAGILPDDLAGKDTIELGCGTAYVSAWLARRGARPVGIDPTSDQLATARMLQREFDVEFPLIRAAGERVPLQSESFDLAISEYGAAIWADPYAWIPEAARLLRTGGRLIFLGNAALMMVCMPADDSAATNTMLRPYFGMHRFDWNDPPHTDFHLPHGEWIRLLRANGFEIEDLIELRPRPGATTEYPFVTTEWARSWPVEEVWKARKVA